MVTVLLLFTHCASDGLTKDEAMRLLRESKSYPAVMDHDVYCGSSEVAKKVLSTSLVADGYMIAQATHDETTIGRPLVQFTEKAQPFLLTTSDTAKSLDVQRVKIADEDLVAIRNIKMEADNKTAVVEYETALKNISPFSELLNRKPEPQQIRITFFSRADNGWVWNKKIIKAPAK